jgi:hypothetical protein
VTWLIYKTGAEMAARQEITLIITTYNKVKDCVLLCSLTRDTLLKKEGKKGVRLNLGCSIVFSVTYD